jgi:3-methyladenine DNA glycosylase AlkC
MKMSEEIQTNLEEDIEEFKRDVQSLLNDWDKKHPEIIIEAIQINLYKAGFTNWYSNNLILKT